MKIFKPLTVFVSLNISLSAIASDLPTGGQVLHGQAQIHTNDISTYVSSKTPKNIISWESFSVGKNKMVVFDDKSYLNLVRGSSASVIEGTVSAVNKGEFYLVNPNGITLSSTGSITAHKVGLSTSKINEKQILNYMDSGDFSTSYQGMGKVKLIGSVKTDNLLIDGSQVIIRDIENIKTLTNDNKVLLTNEDSDNLKIVSSTKRIDIGGRDGIDFSKTYKLSGTDGLVDHTGQTAISTKEELLNISKDLNGSYFITNDIDLGNITNTLTGGSAFTGKIDGAFNNVTFDLTFDGSKDTNIGLLSKLENASVSDLKIKNSKITLENGKNNTSLGALAGFITNSSVSNSDVTDFDVIFSNLGSNKVNTGGIAGVSGTGNTFFNVSASFSQKALQRLNDKENISKGYITGAALSSLTLKGDVFTNNDVSDDSSFKLFGNSSVSYNSLNCTPDTYNYVLTDSGYQLKDFYAPFFVGENETYLYDENKSYNYMQMVNNPYFNVENYVDIKADYTSDINKPGIYNHTYSNKDNGTQFYFVQNKNLKGTLIHSISVVTKPVRAPVPPFTGNFSQDFLNNYADNSDNTLFSDSSKHKFNYDKKKTKSKLSYSKEQESFAKLYSDTLLASLDLSSDDFDYYYAKNTDDNNSQNS